MFNVRVKVFPDGSEQIQIFSHSMASSGEKSLKKCNPFTGEIYDRVTGYLEQVPFESEEFTRVRDMTDPEYTAYKSYVRTKKIVYDLARSNRWEWFLTFTFSPDKVNRYDYEDCSKKMSEWLRNMKRICPDMVYLVVPERHKDGAFHFHGLFLNCWRFDFSFSGHYDKSDRPIFHVGKYNWGFTTATRISDYRKASSYLVKYITKDLCSVTVNKKRYWVTRNAQRPVIEEYDLEGIEEERLMDVLSIYEITNIKKVSTAYVDVTYIEAANLCEKHVLVSPSRRGRL